MRQQDHYLDTPHGLLYARSWTPAGDSGQPCAPIVLLHDSLGCVALWRDFPAALAAATGRQVIAYDRLGFGQSAPHPGGWSARFIHDEAALYFPLLRAALGIDRFVAFGHSVGGVMAAACAAMYPGDCAALITVSAQAWVDQGITDGIREAQAGFAQPGQMERLSRYHGERAAWVLHAWTDTWLSPDFAGWRIERDAPAIRCPMLVIHGDRDEYGSLAHPRHIATLGATPAELLILADCRHTPHREQPAAVLDAARRFLAGR